MPLTEADNSKAHSPGARIVGGIGVFFYLLTSLPALALCCAMAVWDWATGNTDETY